MLRKLSNVESLIISVLSGLPIDVQFLLRHNSKQKHMIRRKGINLTIHSRIHTFYAYQRLKEVSRDPKSSRSISIHHFSSPSQDLVVLVMMYNKFRMVKRDNNQKQEKSHSNNKAPKGLKTISKAFVNRSELREVVRGRFSSKVLESSSKQLRFQHRYSTGQLSKVTDDLPLECSICLELLVNPLMMLCGHMYCAKCLESSWTNIQRCCLCRDEQLFYYPKRSQLAQTLIEAKLSKDSEEVLPYLARQADSEAWLQTRTVDQYIPGARVDIFVRCGGWRVGYIDGCTNDLLGRPMVDVKVAYKTQIFNQSVPVGTRRLAPAGFYTQRKHLEEYGPVFQSGSESQLERPVEQEGPQQVPLQQSQNQFDVLELQDFPMGLQSSCPLFETNRELQLAVEDSVDPAMQLFMHDMHEFDILEV